jgi:hypothetical protein
MKKIKKMADGGKANNEITKAKFAYGPDDEYASKRASRMADIEKEYRGEGRNEGIKRQRIADGASTPFALIHRAGTFIGDKVDDLDAYASKKLGMDERGARKAGMRQGLKDEGYKLGGKVKSASARADGCAIRGKTKA